MSRPVTSGNTLTQIIFLLLPGTTGHLQSLVISISPKPCVLHQGNGSVIVSTGETDG